MLTTHLLLMFKLRMSGATPPISLHAFTAGRGTILPLFLQFKIDLCVRVCVCVCMCALQECGFLVIVSNRTR